MNFSNHIGQRLASTSLWLIVQIAVVAPAMWAQGNSHDSRQIVLGELVGRTDYREFRILTSDGLIPINAANNRSFSVLRQTPQEIIIRFNRWTDATPHTLSVKFFETERSLISALILDEVDVAVLESETSAMEVGKSNPNVVPLPVQEERNKVKLILYNLRNRLFSERKVRQALSYGINHDHIIKKIIKGGKATIARGPFDDNSKLYNTGMKSYKYEPRLALQLLSDLNWADRNNDGVIERQGRDFVIELLYQKGTRLDQELSRQIKINLLKLGIEVQPRPLPKTELNDRLRSGDFEAALVDHVFPDGIESLRDFFLPDAEFNFMGYSSSTIAKYSALYDSSPDELQKDRLVKAIQNIINRDQPATFLYFKWLTHYLINIKRLEGFRYIDGPKRGQVKPYEEWRFKKQ